MSTSQPQNIDEFNAKYNANTRYSGQGFDTKMHMPCPGCAEPDWLSCRIIDVEEAMAAEHACKACGRAFKTEFRRTSRGVSFEVVQTKGDDLPAFMPKIRRAQEQE